MDLRQMVLILSLTFVESIFLIFKITKDDCTCMTLQCESIEATRRELYCVIRNLLKIQTYICFRKTFVFLIVLLRQNIINIGLNFVVGFAKK